MRKKKCYNKDPQTKKQYEDDKSNITENDRKFLNEVPWELSGRQQKGCSPHPILLKRIPVLCLNL